MKKRKFSKNELLWLAEHLDNKQMNYLLEDDNTTNINQNAGAGMNTGNNIDNTKVKTLCKAFGQGIFDKTFTTGTDAKKFFDDLKCNGNELISVLETLTKWPEVAKKHVNGISNILKILQALKITIGTDIKNKLQQNGINVPGLTESIKQKHYNIIFESGNKASNNSLNSKLNKLLEYTDNINKTFSNKSISNISESIKNTINENDVLYHIKKYYNYNHKIKELHKIYEHDMHLRLENFDNYMKMEDNKNMKLNEAMSAIKFSIKFYNSKNKKSLIL